MQFCCHLSGLHLSLLATPSFQTSSGGRDTEFAVISDSALQPSACRC
ncbi:unnamed protein product [Musa hybrid cultivar]